METPDDPKVQISVMHLVLHAAAGLGLDRATLLAEIGLEESALVDRDGYVLLSQQIALGEAMARARPGMNIGLATLDYVRPSMLGVLGYAIRHCANLRAALGAFMRYQAILSPAVSWQLTDEPEPRIIVEAHPRMQALAFPLETQLALWVMLGRRLTGVPWNPRRLQFRHHPAGPPEEFEQRVGCPAEFGAELNALTLPSDVLDLPVVGARPELQPSLLRLLEALKPQEPVEEGCAQQVEALLLEELTQGVTSKEQVAQRMGLSPRTLGRRLQEEGASFRELLESVRQRLAQAWLADPSVAIHEVAYLLGYSEPSTFHRSFRRWTGQTPAAWRDRSARTSG
ncbi:MAG: AraC family transcriptional regulator ligand-binding domain-containing protein [Myxococcota bacterium]